jgi:hypothetical protein
MYELEHEVRARCNSFNFNFVLNKILVAKRQKRDGKQNTERERERERDAQIISGMCSYKKFAGGVELAMAPWKP